ncbi:MAG TPA: hypothetical protein VMZ91_15650 [Candidatus Paceibacterota bacterium]|nr:hypothetical protein [Candidatus Paceibacterota bacterium]
MKLALLYPFPVKMFKILKNQLNISQIVKATGSTQSYVSGIIKKMIKEDLLEIIPTKSKRCKTIYLTKKGMEIKKLILRINELTT